MMRFHRLFRFTLLAGLACAALASVAARPARANLFTFDPTGMGNPNALGQPVGGFDFSVGNLLLRNGTAALATPGTDFQAYYQATTAGLIGASGTNINDPNLNRAYEFTAVGSVTLHSLGGGVFRVADTQSSESFFRLFYDNPATMPGTALANNLAGTGFTDGQLILESDPLLTIAGSLGNYTMLPGGRCRSTSSTRTTGAPPRRSPASARSSSPRWSTPRRPTPTSSCSRT